MKAVEDFFLGEWYFAVPLVCMSLFGAALVLWRLMLNNTAKTDIDDFHTKGREVFWLCKKRQGESTFTNTNMERALKIRATFRGMNTVVRLAAKYRPS